MPANPLDALRDIHLPEAASWWPLAWGYWLLIALAIAGLVALVLRYRALRVRRSAQREFNNVVSAYRQHEDGLRLARELAVLMRRVMLSLKPRQDVARLTGSQWAHAVQQLTPAYQLQDASIEVLSAGVYQPSITIDAHSLITDCAAWFAQVPTTKAAT